MNTAVSGLGDLLRGWRGRRGKSQLELSLDTGISQRHISFIESGRSQPSRQALMEIAQGLDMPLRDRNTLLLAAGYAPAFSEAALDAPEMALVMKALARMLRQHEPYPAIVMDRYWNVLKTNRAAPAFFGRFVDLDRRPSPRNLLDLLFDPAGLRPFIANWNSLAPALLERIRNEAAGGVVDEKLAALRRTLLQYPDVPPALPGRPPAPAAVIPVCFAWRGEVLSYFSMVATIGTPIAIAAQELRLECMFPADAATEELHAAMFRDLPDPCVFG